MPCPLGGGSGRAATTPPAQSAARVMIGLWLPKPARRFARRDGSQREPFKRPDMSRSQSRSLNCSIKAVREICGRSVLNNVKGTIRTEAEVHEIGADRCPSRQIRRGLYHVGPARSALDHNPRAAILVWRLQDAESRPREQNGHHVAMVEPRGHIQARSLDCADLALDAQTVRRIAHRVIPRQRIRRRTRIDVEDDVVGEYQSIVKTELDAAGGRARHSGENGPCVLRQKRHAGGGALRIERESYELLVFAWQVVPEVVPRNPATFAVLACPDLVQTAASHALRPGTTVRQNKREDENRANDSIF